MPPRIAPRKIRLKLERSLLYLFLLSTCIVVIFPYLWMALTSFKPLEEFFTYPLQWFTKNWTLAQYAAVLEDPKFLASLRNSFLVSTIVTVMSLGLSIPAAYGLTRLRAPGGRTILVAILSSQFFPPMIFFVPFYILLSKFKLLNTIPGLVFAYLSVTLPICTWMVAATFRNIAREIEEAAKVDGCGDMRTIYKVVLPAARSGILASFILGMGRAVGETMAVIMVAGNALRIPMSLLDPLRTLTSNIALELAYASGDHRSALFSAGVVLLTIIMVLNFVANFWVKRKVAG